MGTGFTFAARGNVCGVLPECGIGSSEVSRVQKQSQSIVTPILAVRTAGMVIDKAAEVLLAEFSIRFGKQNELVPGKVNAMRRRQPLVRMQRDENEEPDGF